MAAAELSHLWQRLAEPTLSGTGPRLRARFSGDAEAKTPVFLVVDHGEPMVELSPEARALFDDGASVDVYYNQALLDPGPCDLGAEHYLGQSGRLRPDATIIVSPGPGTRRACVIEVKLTSDARYLLEGFHEAQLYRAEYRQQLGGWPQAILVASEAMTGAARRSDDVVAGGLDRWVPEEIARRGPSSLTSVASDAVRGGITKLGNVDPARYLGDAALADARGEGLPGCRDRRQIGGSYGFSLILLSGQLPREVTHGRLAAKQWCARNR